MKKRLFVLFMVASMIFPSRQQAQSFTTGIIGGGSTTSVKITDVAGNAAISNINGNSITGFEGGLFGRLNLGPVFIKPMVLTSYQYGTVTFTNTNGTVNSPNFDYGTLEIPILVGIRFFKFLRIEGGPVYNWIYSTHYSGGTSVTVDPSGWGYRLGANVEFGIINLGFAFQGLNNTQTGTTTDAKFSSPNELIVSLAFCFGGK
jgi:hypothetical protein